MKKYRVRKGSVLDNIIGAVPGAFVITMLILLMGLGTHFIDGV